MNVNSNGPNAPRSTDRYREAMDSFVQRTRVRLAHAKHIASRMAEVRQDQAAADAPNTARRPDSVEISNRDVPEVGRDVTNDEVLRPKVARLKHLYRTGQLFKPGMLERAARALLEHRHEVPNTGSGPVQPGASSEPTAPKPNTESGPSQPPASSLPTQPKAPPAPAPPPASSLPTQPKAPPAPPAPELPPASSLPTKPKAPPAPAPPPAFLKPVSIEHFLNVEPKAPAAPPPPPAFLKPVSFEHFLNVEPAEGPNTGDAPNLPGGPNL